MELMNRHQPVRPRYTEDGQPLLYATMPKTDKRMPFFCTPPAMVCQTRLYRAARAGNIPTRVAIAELYDYLFYDYPDVPKKQMGSTIVSALIYEPRMLVNNASVGKATSVYCFRHPLDLIYGLEWQICTWLRRFLAKDASPKRSIAGPEAHEIELDKLATVPEHEFVLDYEGQFKLLDEPNWNVALEGKKEWSPPKDPTPVKPRPPKPRDLSVL